MKLYCFERVIILRNKVSSEDVAKLANVSQSTVSRAFTPNASISAEAKEKVLKA
ncbi:LacI family DNA-binding transcriptional regulator, partial [Nosocomiicoccus massiliensis]|uniref:LacI family DNA-binding transcriptional regulator n=1 Tax=Nosocomiicoccus massiliensis TaxID=1232430 RepID=UPI0011DDE04D